jgi:putative FmdB family regulatory protein
MPLYEYQCDKCGDLFEVMQKFSDEPLTRHQKCGGHVHRLLSAPALQFKGSGWYITDYAKGAGTSSSANGGKSESGKAETSTTSSETKSSSSESKASS